jgi:carbon-monoxide dehydrogenase medium subunit
VSAETTFVAPETVDEAVSLLSRPGAMAVAGGTSIGLLVGQGLIDPDRLVWLGRLPGLDTIRRDAGQLVIGAGVTLRELVADADVAATLPAVADAAAAVGNPRIRAVATVGGALAHADPRQDLPPALLAHEATVEIAGPAGTRSISLAGLATGFMTTALADDELITAVAVPVVTGRRSAYERFAPGSSDDYPTVAVAATCTPGRTPAVLVAVGGAGPTAYLVPEAASLAGDDSPEARAAVAGAAVSLARPTDDRLGSAAYKRAMVATWVERVLALVVTADGRAGA